MKRWGILGACALVGLSGCARTTPAERAQAPAATIAVRTATVARDAQSRRVEVAVTIRPVQRASVAAKVSGMIARFPGGLGQRVAAGETLLMLNAPEIAARVDQARARCAEAERTAERARALTEKGVDAPDTRRDAEDRLRVAQGVLAEAEAMADYVTIRAPFEGVITEKLVLEGDLATPGMPLLVLESTGPLRAEGAIPERAAVTMKRGDLVPVELEGGGEPLVGQIEELSPTADPTSRSVWVKVALPRGRGRSGQFGRLLLATGQGPGLSVPAAALSPFGQMERVFVVEGGQARLRLIKTGRIASGRVEVLAGIDEGELVVLEPGPLRDGAPVTVQP